MDALKAEAIKVFLPDEELGWISAEIVNEVKRGHYEIYIDDEDYADSLPKTKVITLKSLPGLDALPMQNEDIPSTGVDDMAKLNFLHEASILDNLRRRFRSALPYAYTGDILIATNPYHWLDIYTTELMEEHKEFLRHTLAPHAYATSAAAYRGLRDFGKNQSILVSGESGAGKTETVKILMGHLAHISGKMTDETVDRVLKANPLMESFGNAKTARNDNSSRFGKFTQLQFDELTFLKGSRCVTYLLEKTRVVAVNEQERSYHIFYQLLAAPPRTKAALKLTNKSCMDFMYVNRGDVQTKAIEGVFDSDGFAKTMEILALVGIDNTLQLDLLRILSGILHLGQIQFSGDSEQSTVDKASFDAVAICCELFGLSPAAFIEKMTSRRLLVEKEYMKVNISVGKALEGRDALAKETYNRLFMWLVAVVNRSTVSALGKDLNTPKQQAKATMEELQRLREIDEDNGDSEQDDRDTVNEGDGTDSGDDENGANGSGKSGNWGLFNLFGLLGSAETKTGSSSSSSSSSSPLDLEAFRLFTPTKSKPTDGSSKLEKNRGKEKSLSAMEKKKLALRRDPPKPVERLIGLLDIFGFENFNINYFEQLCINFANERLQRRFTQDVFVIVQEEYKREGLKWEAIKCMDNSAALELLEGRLGIIDLLNEESMRGQGNDLNFLAKMKSLCGAHPCYASADVKMQKDAFAIKHYAGRVVYSVAGFVDRNNDTLSDEIRNLMISSNNQLVKNIFNTSSVSSSDEVVVAAGGNVTALESEATNSNAELKVGNGSNKMQSFLKAASVTQKFKTQLANLMTCIEGTTVQYVRCIKPNSIKSALHFDRKMVVEQLRCAGMIDAIRISRSAYPYRVTHAEFVTRFEGLRSRAWMRRKSVDTPLARCKVLLEDVIKYDAPQYLHALVAEQEQGLSARERRQLNTNQDRSNGSSSKGKGVAAAGGGGGSIRQQLENEKEKTNPSSDKISRLRTSLEDRPYEIGKTKVYFSAGLLEMFEDLRNQRIFKHIVDMQRVYRGHQGRVIYRALLQEQMKAAGMEQGCMAVLGNCKMM